MRKTDAWGNKRSIRIPGRNDIFDDPWWLIRPKIYDGKEGEGYLVRAASAELAMAELELTADDIADIHIDNSL